MLRAFLAPLVVTLLLGVAAATAHLAQVAETLAIVEGEAAMVTIAIRPDRAADFDRVLERTKRVLARSQNPQRRAQAAGWQVFKSEEMVQGNATYVMRIDQTWRNTAYSPPTIVAEESPSEGADIRTLLREIVIGDSTIALSAVPVPGLGDLALKLAEVPRASDPRPPVLSFDTAEAAVITIVVRPEREDDFISTLGYLGKALQANRGAPRQRQAAGWRVLKGTQRLGGNVVYVMSLDPLVQRAEYDVIRLIQESFPGDVDAIFQSYRGAYVGQAVARLTGRVDMSK